jgi:putative membrane protein
MATSLLTRIRQELSTTTRWLPLAAWLLLMVLTPVALWAGGERGFIALTIAGVLTQLSAVLVLLAGRWSAARLARVVSLVLLCSWAVEFLGSRTGFPFGAYQYSPLLQPQLGGVPLLIPAAWLMMLLPSWAIASRLCSPHRRLIFALVSGLVFTAWDLYLDPQMVANGLWAWQQPGAYFGIPLTNYLGWWLAATLITLAAAPPDLHLLLDDLQARGLALVYSLTWLLQAAGLAFFWGQPLPALCGFIGMGIFVLLFWRKELRS